MTGNIKSGSANNRDAYLQYQQTQEYPKLEKMLFGKNIYYGKSSESRTIRIYDKALQLRQTVLKKTDEPDYINSLIDWCESNGIIRFETEYKRYLRNNDLRKWQNATHEKLSNKFREDINQMTKEIEVADLEEVPTPYLQTLCMYLSGMHPKKLLSAKTYYKHRKELKKYGYDISNDNIHMLKPKVRIITLEPAGVPDFYKHANIEGL